jgi:hypothetical protein
MMVPLIGILLLTVQCFGQNPAPCLGEKTVINMKFSDIYHEVAPVQCSNCGPNDELCPCDPSSGAHSVPPPPPSNIGQTWSKVCSRMEPFFSSFIRILTPSNAGVTEMIGALSRLQGPQGKVCLACTVKLLQDKMSLNPGGRLFQLL